MTLFRPFEDMQVWHESRNFLRSIRQICMRDVARRDFSFVDQITRSARSISANIAEGADAMTFPDFIKFLGYAKRSAAETRSHLYDALDEQYITREELDVLSNQAKKICSMLAKLIHHLQAEKPRPRTSKQQPSNSLRTYESTNIRTYEITK